MNETLVKVKLSTVEAGNAELLLIEVKDYLEVRNQTIEGLKNEFKLKLIENGMNQTYERFLILEKIYNQDGYFSMNMIRNTFGIGEAQITTRSIRKTFGLLETFGFIYQTANNDNDEKIINVKYCLKAHNNE